MVNALIKGAPLEELLEAPWGLWGPSKDGPPDLITPFVAGTQPVDSAVIPYDECLAVGGRYAYA